VESKHKYKASDFDEELLNLFDRYIHGLVDRRGFLEGATKFALVGLTAGDILEILSPKYAEARQVAEDDKRIETEYTRYESPKGYGTIKGYLARPVDARVKLPGIIAAHELRGLNPNIEDVVRRLALAGYIAFGPDGLSPVGGYPGNDERAVQMMRQLEVPKIIEDFVAAAGYLKMHAACNGKIGAVGFCLGGGIVYQVAVRIPELAAGVSFYGDQPSQKDTAKIKAPLLIQYAEMDDRINVGWPAFEAALKANGVKYTMYRYPGTQHGFHNNTTPRYEETAAALSWQRTVDFFHKNLVS
jgi:carboxymethylenebutenolidase